jgi:hypothetical protein
VNSDKVPSPSILPAKLLSSRDIKPRQNHTSLLKSSLTPSSANMNMRKTSYRATDKNTPPYYTPMKILPLKKNTEMLKSDEIKISDCIRADKK